MPWFFGLCVGIEFLTGAPQPGPGLLKPTLNPKPFLNEAEALSPLSR